MELVDEKGTGFTSRWLKEKSSNEDIWGGKKRQGIINMCGEKRVLEGRRKTQDQEGKISKGHGPEAEVVSFCAEGRGVPEVRG